MEKNNLLEMWASHDRKLSQNTHLNKAILKKLLMSTLVRQLSKANYTTFISLICFMCLVVFLTVRLVTFQPTFTFVFGFAAYVVALGLAMIDYLRYTGKQLRIQPDAPILEARKKQLEIEQYRNKMNRKGRIYALIFASSLWFVVAPETRHQLLNLVQNSPLSLLVEAMLAGLLVLLVVGLFRNRTTKKLKQAMHEIEALETNADVEHS
jgi:uncharacterized membrane protein